jgi:geranylgeranyl diphosphate synthase type I
MIRTEGSVAVPEALVRHRSLIDGGLRQAVDRLSPSIRQTIAYHLGWCDAEGIEIHGNGGKAVRPAITLLAAEAVGAHAEDALAGAVALELVHNFSLIHDDVMDGDAERRHRPTVWALFGVSRAIVAGDALMTLAQEVLLEGERPERLRAAAEIATATATMIAGQAEDLAFESRLDVTEEEVLAMSAHKTGALLACAGALGAILGGGDDRALVALRTFGHHIGVAFQAVDDVLGIWGDPAVTGKPAANDLRQHKKTLPVVHVLASARGHMRDELIAVFRGGEPSGDALSRAVHLIDEADGRAWTLALADLHLGEALAALDQGGFLAGPAAELAEVARFVVRRDF